MVKAFPSDKTWSDIQHHGSRHAVECIGGNGHLTRQRWPSLNCELAGAIAMRTGRLFEPLEFSLRAMQIGTPHRYFLTSALVADLNHVLFRLLNARRGPSAEGSYMRGDEQRSPAREDARTVVGGADFARGADGTRLTRGISQGPELVLPQTTLDSQLRFVCKGAALLGSCTPIPLHIPNTTCKPPVPTYCQLLPTMQSLLAILLVISVAVVDIDIAAPELLGLNLRAPPPPCC
ncbi:hypothetical protein KEM48_000933 [Puccinia striiformis f. sp. tritici PST-130]|nr:hypothetical protein KEM48_000933 [Puccinia striiformis f. sp. tritici PST-130]